MKQDGKKTLFCPMEECNVFRIFGTGCVLSLDMKTEEHSVARDIRLNRPDNCKFPVDAILKRMIDGPDIWETRW